MPVINESVQRKEIYQDGIPEERLWDPENQVFMKRSLFDGQWVPERGSVWDVEKPEYQYDPNRDRTYQQVVFGEIPRNSGGLPGIRNEPYDIDQEEPGNIKPNYPMLTSPKQKNPSLSAHFDGSHLVIRDKHGDKINSESYPAVSGRPDKDGKFDNSRERQKIPDVGPIPEGNYWINPQEITKAPKRGSLSDIVNTSGGIFPKLKYSGFPGGHTAWGKGRIDIRPSKVIIDGVKRDGFTIHGGDEPGSAGCIDLNDNEKKLFDFLEKHRGDQDSIPLFVKYPRK